MTRKAKRTAVWIGLTVVAVAAGAYGIHVRRAHDALRVSFNADVRPILNQYCMSCHGGVRQLNGVSFAYREEALGRGRSGRPTVVPGHPEKSELISRVTTHDPETRMPYHGSPLPPEKIEVLRQWIKQGAEWQDYWAFTPPRPQSLPVVKHAGWPRQSIDRFILARLERENLEPSPEAERSELLRRVSLDLVGLPPTPEEQAAFLADTSPDAYEKQVDRLLASPQYGERWASMWLDLARYADSAGYESDPNRKVWPYRDWVVNALNHDLPYDQFVVEQLAGDLLPNASYDQRIATTFHRLSPTNYEGGTDSEEYRLVAVMDRVATTWEVLNGLTMNCVQCHGHPYDPIKHVEYYKFMAFFNSTRDADLDDDTPWMPVPADNNLRGQAVAQYAEWQRLRAELVDSGRRMTEASAWQALPISAGTVTELPPMYAAKDAPPFKARPPAPIEVVDGAAKTTGTLATHSVLDLSAPLAGTAVTALRIVVPPANEKAARHSPEDGFVVRAIQAWWVGVKGDKHPIAVQGFAADSTDNLPFSVRLPFDIHIDATGFAAKSKLFHPRWVVLVPRDPLVAPAGSTLHVQLTHERELDYKPAVIRHLSLSTSSDPLWTRWPHEQQQPAKLARLAQLEQALFTKQTVRLPVMEELPPAEARETLELERGNIRNPIGEALQPDMPEVFPKLPADAPRNRLTMARWFFGKDQPLTARVAVNRYWEELFGAGLVETLENFGSAGEQPSHPELLDWLALHFQNDLHWDMKALLRELVTSSTYRQSASATPELQQHDPNNRWLGHGPQQRLTAEMIRDQALLASGLLSTKMGGPPVMPPQPAGVWMTVYDGDKWHESTGPDRYRRALYTFLKRSAIYPSYLVFDGSARTVSLPRRIATNTPLQALVTLNDPVYQEAAAALARRMLAAAPGNELDNGELFAQRIDFGARCVLSRELDSAEIDTLRQTFDDLLRMPEIAGAKPGDASAKARAAYTALANALLNLDAAFTR